MTQEQFKDVKFLNLNQLTLLADDLIGELEDRNMSHATYLVVWFLRNKCYAPFNAIAKATGYSQTSNCTRAYDELLNGQPTPYSLAGEHYDILCIFKQVADRWYGMSANKYLDRVEMEYEEAFLWLASQECDIVDSRKNAPSYTPTPKQAPEMVLLVDIIDLLKEGDYETVMQNYIITKTI